MKRNPIVIVLSACFVSLLSFHCGQNEKAATTDHSADEAAIHKADSLWSVATGSKQMNDFLSYVADDGIVGASNAPMAKGKGEIQKLMGGFFAIPGFTVKWQANKIEVAGSGDIGYSTGTYQLSLDGPQGKPINDNGKYLTVWKKQTDGSWKVSADLFNSDIPLPQPSQQ